MAMNFFKNRDDMLMNLLQSLFGQHSTPAQFYDTGKDVVNSGYTVGSVLAEKVSNFIDDACHILFD